MSSSLTKVFYVKTLGMTFETEERDACAIHPLNTAHPFNRLDPKVHKKT